MQIPIEAPEATSPPEADADADTCPEAWTGDLTVTPDMVQQILDANEIADATEEQA